MYILCFSCNSRLQKAFFLKKLLSVWFPIFPDVKSQNETVEDQESMELEETNHCKICLNMLFLEDNSCYVESGKSKEKSVAELEISFLGFQIQSRSRYICLQCIEVLELRCKLRTELFEMDQKIFYTSQGMVNERLRDDANIESENDIDVKGDSFLEINNVNMHDYCNSTNDAECEQAQKKSNQNNSSSSTFFITKLNPNKSIVPPTFDTSKYLFRPPQHNKTILQNQIVSTLNNAVSHNGISPVYVVNSLPKKNVSSQNTLIVNTPTLNPSASSTSNKTNTLVINNPLNSSTSHKTIQQNTTEFVKLNSTSFQTIINTISTDNLTTISCKNVSCQTHNTGVHTIVPTVQNNANITYRSTLSQTKESGEQKFPWSNDETPGTNAYIFVKWPSSMKYKRCTKDTTPIIISIFRGLLRLIDFTLSDESCADVLCCQQIGHTRRKTYRHVELYLVVIVFFLQLPLKKVKRGAQRFIRQLIIIRKCLI